MRDPFTALTKLPFRARGTKTELGEIFGEMVRELSYFQLSLNKFQLFRVAFVRACGEISICVADAEFI